MAYRLKLKEPIGRAVKRIGREQIERATTALQASDAVDGIHQTRKAIKRLRALLRLIRPGIEKAQYKQLNTILGDAGRKLSATRDRDVLARTIAGLMEAGEVPTRAARTAADTLIASGSHAHVADADAARQAARALLVEAGEAWLELKPDPDGFEVIAAGLERGMTELAAAYSDGTRDDDEAIHDLRKCVQRHWRHMQLLEAAWPGYFSARAEEAEALSDLLGRSQDLTLLVHCLEAADPDAKKALDDLAKRAEKERKALRKLGQAHAARLVAESASSHARRAQAYWDAAVAIKSASKSEVHAARTAAPAAAQPAIPEPVPPSRKRSPRAKAAKATKRGGN